ncbi:MULTISPECIES: hypothetical protein [unclassified Moorena]|nr:MULTISPECIES: hypothetical protein [unclassified Moorena]NEQ07990.1 hypothetical protein [Moorena sp. SIO4E2]NEQ12625.1 hypothetical protein [Moorena sp. SIO3E2]NER86358.1 hypothetical protein [Moorena sp. SIO3A2]
MIKWYYFDYVPTLPQIQNLPTLLYYPTTEPNAIAQPHRMRSHKRGS